MDTEKGFNFFVLIGLFRMFMRGFCSLNGFLALFFSPNHITSHLKLLNRSIKLGKVTGSSDSSHENTRKAAYKGPYYCTEYAFHEVHNGCDCDMRNG